MSNVRKAKLIVSLSSNTSDIPENQTLPPPPPPPFLHPTFHANKIKTMTKYDKETAGVRHIRTHIRALAKIFMTT